MIWNASHLSIRNAVPSEKRSIVCAGKGHRVFADPSLGHRATPSRCWITEGMQLHRCLMQNHGKAVSYASIAELFPDWFWPAGPARPGLGVQKPGPAQPRVQRMRCTKYAVVSQCVCMINEEHGQQKDHCSFAGVCSFSTSAREGLKKNIFFLRKCFEILNILQKCFSGLSAAGLHPSAGPARPGPEPTNSAPSWGPKKRRGV